MKVTQRWVASLALLASKSGSASAAVPLNQLLTTFGSLSERETAFCC